MQALEHQDHSVLSLYPSTGSGTAACQFSWEKNKCVDDDIFYFSSLVPSSCFPIASFATLHGLPLYVFSLAVFPHRKK